MLVYSNLLAEGTNGSDTHIKLNALSLCTHDRDSEYKEVSVLRLQVIETFSPVCVLFRVKLVCYGWNALTEESCGDTQLQPS
jgi:hypothetical protein